MYLWRSKISVINNAIGLGVFIEGYNNERTDCEKIVMTSSNFVTASTNYENILLSESYKIDKKKIKLIKPGVDESLFSPDPNLSKENIFLSIGRIQKQKRQLEAIEFLSSFREIDIDYSIIDLYPDSELLSVNDNDGIILSLLLIILN